MTEQQQDQQDHRGAVAGVFDRVAPDYDQVGVDFFTSVGTALVALAELRTGERVVDVGCGRGAVLFAAAEAVGSDGSVLGVDLAPGMVSLTGAQAAERGLTQVRTAVMDAQEPDVEPDSFDVVLSSLVLFFLPDAAAGLRAWRRATRDDGRIAITTFAGRDDPRWSWLSEVLPSRDASRTSETGDDSPFESDDDDTSDPFGSDQGLHALLAGAGWKDAASVTRTQVVRFDDPSQWLRWSWSTGTRFFWEKVAESDRPAREALAFEHLRRMQDEPDGLELRMDVRYTTAVAG